MKPLDVLKKGLTKLHNQIHSRKSKLTTELKAGWTISEADQEWLDGDGNPVDEDWVVQTLDNASDYDRELQRLDSQDKAVVQKLQSLVGEGGTMSSKK